MGARARLWAALAVAAVGASGLAGCTEDDDPIASPYCAVVARIDDVEAEIAALPAVPSPDQLRSLVGRLRELTDEAVGVAPPELADTLADSQRSLGQLVALMEQHGFDLASVAADPAYTELFDVPEAEQPGRVLDDYAADHC